MNKISGIQACQFIKKRLQHRCFPVNFPKILRISFYRTPLGDYFCLFEPRNSMEVNGAIHLDNSGKFTLGEFKESTKTIFLQ